MLYDEILKMDENDFTINMTDTSTGSIDLINPRTPWKYNEDRRFSKNFLIMFGELTISTTLLVMTRFKLLDLIEACGDGEAFCRSNILKYASRYDKKGTARRDIMKILHYAVLLMHFNDKNAKRETYNQ